MNYKIEEKVEPSSWTNFVFSRVIVICLLICFFCWGDIPTVILGRLAIVTQILFDKYIYLPSAIRLKAEDDVLEIKLLFRKVIVIQLAQITEIELTGKWSSDGRYYIIKYEGRSINTYLMSVNSRMSLNDFMEELQGRIDNAKKK